MLSRSPERNLEPKLSWLQTRLQLDPAQLKKIVLQCPAVFSNSTVILDSKLTYLESRLALTNSQLLRLLLGLSTILSLSIEDNLEPLISFLEHRLQKTPEELSAFILRYPIICGANSAKIESRIQFLRSHFELTDADALKFVDRRPQVLTMVSGSKRIARDEGEAGH